MTRTFIYIVNGTEIEDTEAFGTAWETAKMIAKNDHCGIDRVVICGTNIRYEFFTTGGFFANERFRDDYQIKGYIKVF